jgi:hypothetical protein
VLIIIEVLGTIMIDASFAEIFCMYNVFYRNIGFVNYMLDFCKIILLCYANGVFEFFIPAETIGCSS